tara:strand:+ start:537 stop:773 length:237 start_codon:yes stop_codon:yes gene_type:complete
MKKLIFYNVNSLLVNIFLICFLIFAIQNSQEKKVIKVFNRETIELPISFTLGTSFVTGSLVGSFIFSIFRFKGNDIEE